MGNRDDTPDVMEAIAAGDLDPIYCLHGPERYLVDRCLAALRAVALDPRTAGFNHDVFDLREVSPAKLVNAAKTVPMMAKRRLVVGRGVDGVKADDLEPLLGYVDDPSPTTCLVLVGDKIDTRFKVFQAMRKAGFLHEWKPLPDRELPGWIAAEAKARGGAIDQAAARELADLAGPSLGRLAQAIEQLILYVGPGKRIGLDDVETLVAETRQRGVFELTKAVGAGQREAALRLLANMLENRESPIYIHVMLTRQLRQIWRAKELLGRRAPRGEIAAAVGINPYFLDDVLGPARQMSESDLERAYRRLLAADRALKSSRVSDELLVTRLVDGLVAGATAH